MPSLPSSCQSGYRPCTLTATTTGGVISPGTTLLGSPLGADHLPGTIRGPGQLPPTGLVGPGHDWPFPRAPTRPEPARLTVTVLAWRRALRKAAREKPAGPQPDTVISARGVRTGCYVRGKGGPESRGLHWSQKVWISVILQYRRVAVIVAPPILGILRHHRS